MRTWSIALFNAPKALPFKHPVKSSLSKQSSYTFCKTLNSGPNQLSSDEAVVTADVIMTTSTINSTDTRRNILGLVLATVFD